MPRLRNPRPRRAPIDKEEVHSDMPGQRSGRASDEAPTTASCCRLIHTPTRLAHSAHRQVQHLPRDWPYEPGLDELFRRALYDPLPTAA